MKSKLSRARARISGRYAVAAALILVLGIPSLAIGFGEGNPTRGGKRNPSENATRAYSSETEIIADTTTYGTRQSNKRDGDGGGAIYGCRSNPGNEPCLRASNLKGGRAFEIDTVGKEAGRIEVGDPTSAPFSTNGKGTVQNLSADALDGRDSADYDDAKTLDGRQPSDYDDARTLEGRSASSFAAASELLFAVVNQEGTTATGKGSPAVSKAGNTYTVTFDNRDVSACSYGATAVGTTPQALAVARGGSVSQVVVTRDTADPDTAFHLQVIC